MQSPCPSVGPSVHTFVKDVSAATGRNDFIFDTRLWHSDFYPVSPFQAYRTSTSSLPRDLEFFMFAVMKAFVTDISASTGRNYFIFDMWLWHGDLYRVSPFQVYCTSTSCLPCDLVFFMFAVMKIFVTDISASTGRNDFIFDIWLLHGDLYRFSPFQVYSTSTCISCLQCDLEFFMFAVINTFVTDISASTGRNDFIFGIWLLHDDLYRFSPFQVYRTSTSCLQCDLEFFMFAVIKTFVTDILASTGRNDFIFDIWLLHGELYHVSPFQVYRTSTSCLPRNLEFFMFAVMKTFVIDISASTGRNNFIFDIWLLHGDLYRVSSFQVTVITIFFSLWLHKSLLCTFQPVYNDVY